jgi:hypothetical protein
MIRIKKSSTTRSCDWSKVSSDQLLKSSKQHIDDIQQGMSYFSDKIMEAAKRHDHTKISHHDQFYADFRTGFQVQEWYAMHKAVERHHLNSSDGVRDDVDLVDVIEHIVDCVMAGKARTGKVYPLQLSNEVLQRAFENTVEKFKAEVEVVE